MLSPVRGAVRLAEVRKALFSAVRSISWFKQETYATQEYLANSTFNYLDAFDMDEQLTGEERSLKDQARIYCQEKLMPRVLEAYRQESTHPFKR